MFSARRGSSSIFPTPRGLGPRVLIHRQSGNLDGPPSSDYRETAGRIVREILDNTQTSHDISPSGELYRAIERVLQRRGTELQSESQLPSVQSMADQEPDRRRRSHREDQETSPLFVLPSNSPQVEPSLRERAAARVSGIATRRGRSRLAIIERSTEIYRTNGESSPSNGLIELQQAGRQLEQASSAQRALLDDPVPSISSPSMEPANQYSPDSEQGRRAKRRKIENDKVDPGFKGFSYGRYGQVEPGKLKMEIVSCDGGIFSEHGGNYSAENVLKNDSTVYCTKSNRCNLVLRHQGATAFSLKELIIKAPHSGYTAPVQEGMVFISMTSDDLLTRTAQYQIQYSPAKPRRSGSQRSNVLPQIVSVRHNDDGTMTTAQARARRLYNIGLEDEDCDYRTAQIPSEFTENAPPFQVTTECSDTEDDETPAQSSRHRTLHRVMGTIRFDDSDSSENDETETPGPWLDNYIVGLDRSPRLRRRETASNITLAEAAEASQIATQEAVRAVGGELMAPHARFFIERDKSKCTVKFDPPVSGRFILLKMWSPHHSSSSNIDIQSVVAKGFAGPRFFPAITMQ
ncbi:regulator of chromosome condensation (RCC1)-like protein [Diplocarpon rosae]|nr:regulator of chromosome condensation (RCC1)-like protein [Diplocarpon rosae]